jgi:hypothetical protein
MKKIILYDSIINKKTIYFSFLIEIGIIGILFHSRIMGIKRRVLILAIIIQVFTQLLRELNY